MFVLQNEADRMEGHVLMLKRVVEQYLMLYNKVLGFYSTLFCVVLRGLWHWTATEKQWRLSCWCATVECCLTALPLIVQKIVDEQMALKRMADIAIDIYAETASLARASRSKCVGMRNCDHEVSTRLVVPSPPFSISRACCTRQHCIPTNVLICACLFAQIMLAQTFCKEASDRIEFNLNQLKLGWFRLRTHVHCLTLIMR